MPFDRTHRCEGVANVLLLPLLELLRLLLELLLLALLLELLLRLLLEPDGWWGCCELEPARGRGRHGRRVGPRGRLCSRRSGAERQNH